MERYPLNARFSDRRTGGNSLNKVVVSGKDNGWLANVYRLIDPERAELVPHIPDENGVASFDFVVITDETQPHCEGSRIDLHNFITRHYNFEIYRALASLHAINEKTRCFVTGLSYAEVGIDADELPFPSVNLAVSSQDLFYDFEFAKHLFSVSEFASNMRYALICLAYYSFEYDASKSSSVGSRTLMYYPFLKTLHHFVVDSISEFNDFEEQAQKVFRENYMTVLYDILRERDESWWPRMVNGKLNDRKIREAEEQAKRDSAKDYPITVKENVNILTEYVDFLQKRNVEPVLFVCPTLGCYRNFFSNRLKNEFLDITNRISGQYGIQLVDCFDSNLFGESDFYDATHLNANGAKKFTKILRDRVWAPRA